MDLSRVLKKAKALVFDFDGTLVDSNPIKRRAFEACFEGFPKREEILSYCLNRHHTPRGEKFRHAMERILGVPYTEEWGERLSRRFEELTTEPIVRAPALPGAESFLRRVRRTHRCAVLSSTPHEVLCAILRRRGWEDLFHVIRGAPVEKGAWLIGFARKCGFTPGEVVFFGDTPEDEASAREADCRFILIETEAGFVPVRTGCVHENT